LHRRQLRGRHPAAAINSSSSPLMRGFDHAPVRVDAVRDGIGRRSEQCAKRYPEVALRRRVPLIGGAELASEVTRKILCPLIRDAQSEEKHQESEEPFVLGLNQEEHGGSAKCKRGEEDRLDEPRVMCRSREWRSRAVVVYAEVFDARTSLRRDFDLAARKLAPWHPIMLLGEARRKYRGVRRQRRRRAEGWRRHCFCFQRSMLLGNCKRAPVLARALSPEGRAG
jgi:hypothetical protein